MTTEPRRRNRAGFYAFAFTAVVATGLVNLFAESWDAAFRFNLILHPLLGTGLAILLLVSLFTALRAQIPGLTFKLITAAVVIVFAAMVRAFTLQHLPIYVSNVIAGLLIPLLACVGMFFFVTGVPLMPTITRSRNAWLNLALITIWLTAAMLGLFILIGASAGRVPSWVFDFHTAAGLTATVLGFGALGVPAFRSGGLRALLEGAALALVLLAVAGVALNVLSPSPPSFPPVTAHLSTTPLEQRLPEDRDPVPLPVPAKWVEVTASCGGSDCHAEIVEDVAHSVHDLTYRTEHMHKVLGLLSAEEGEHNQAICAGCHVPGSLFEDGPSADDYRDLTHLSCVFCHSVTEAAVDGHFRSHWTVELATEHLHPFVEAEARGELLSRWQGLGVQLNPRAHGRAFRQDVIAEDRFCQSCHHMQVRERDESQRCVDCHMVANELNRRPDDDSQLTAVVSGSSHRFPGANSTLHRLLGRDDEADQIERFLAGELFLEALEDFYDSPPRRARLEGQARRENFFYAEIETAFSPPPRPGAETELSVTTRNLRLGHPFPSSSLDLEEAWLEVEVTDENGDRVFSAGGVDLDGRVLSDAPRLGGYLMGRDGERVRHYRVWQIAEEVVERRIPIGGEVTDRFTWTVPPGSTRHLTVRARWRYRKLGHDFWRWAYPDRPAIPSAVVVEHFAQHAVEGSSDVGQHGTSDLGSTEAPKESVEKVVVEVDGGEPAEGEVPDDGLRAGHGEDGQRQGDDRHQQHEALGRAGHCRRRESAAGRGALKIRGCAAA